MISENSQIDTNEISLKDLILKIKEWVNYLQSNWKYIILLSMIGSSIGLLISFTDKPTYKATLTFTMEEDRGTGGNLSGAMGLASSLGLDLGGSAGGAFSANNIIELMKSRLIIEKALLNSVYYNKKKISFAEYYIQIHNLREYWKSKPKLINIQFPIDADRSTFTLQQDSILQNIFKSVSNEKYLSIKQKDKKITIITLEVNSIDEAFSKMFCENLASEVSQFYIETKSKKAKINVEALQKQADSIRTELNNAISGVAVEADNVYNLNPALNKKTTPSKKKQVDVQANTAILTQLVAQLEIAKVGLRKETPLIQMIDKPILPLDKEKLSKLKCLIFGGVFGAFFAVLYFISKRFYKELLK
jgi:uncharacterized protein involved in exopolysaccharide biosynthesis